MEAHDFVVMNMARVRYYTTWVSRLDARIDNDDLLQDLVEDLLRVHHKYDPTRGGPGTWIYMRARSVQRRYLSQLNRWRTMSIDDVDLPAPDSTERNVLARQIVDLATPLQREALLSCVLGHVWTEVPEHLGVTHVARYYRLRSLAAKLSSGDEPKKGNDGTSTHDKGSRARAS